MDNTVFYHLRAKYSSRLGHRCWVNRKDRKINMEQEVGQQKIYCPDLPFNWLPSQVLFFICVLLAPETDTVVIEREQIVHNKNIGACPHDTLAIYNSHFITKTTVGRCFATRESKLTSLAYCIRGDYCFFGFRICPRNSYVCGFDRRLECSLVELWHKAQPEPAYWCAIDPLVPSAARDDVSSSCLCTCKNINGTNGHLL